MQAEVKEQRAKNDELAQQLDGHRAECARLQMCIEEENSQASRVAHELKDFTEYRDGILSDLKTMTVYMQKAEEMLQAGVV